MAVAGLGDLALMSRLSGRALEGEAEEVHWCFGMGEARQVAEFGNERDGGDEVDALERGAKALVGSASRGPVVPRNRGAARPGAATATAMESL
jgi:hypothetical protein